MSNSNSPTTATRPLTQEPERFSQAVQRLRAVASWASSARDLAEALDFCYGLEGKIGNAQAALAAHTKAADDARVLAVTEESKTAGRIAALTAEVKAAEAAAAARIAAAEKATSEAEAQRAEIETKLTASRQALRDLQSNIAGFSTETK